MKKHKTYEEALEFLYSQLPMYQRIGGAAYKANLDNTYKLDSYLGHPHRNFKSIHIAGTNGKGSVSHMLTSILIESGLKVGLYTSPHLKDFRERIKINNSMIKEVEVVDFINDHYNIIEDIKPSFFELTVAMAFDFFSKKDVDIAVIEVGLGGRLDSTNIITPILSIITNIGLDHTQFLGTTLKSIAMEKAGIIKQKIPVVIGESHPETIGVFKSVAKDNNSEIIQADKLYHVTNSTRSIINEQIFFIEKNGKTIYKGLKTDLTGLYQKKNISTVLASVDLIKNIFNINDDNIYKGVNNVIKNTSLLGRWQIIDNNPLVICDIAHNIDGLKEIVSQISNTPHKNLHIIIGMVQDKNIDDMLLLLPKNATYYFTKANIPRSMNENLLQKQASKIGLKGFSYESVSSAYSSAKNNSTPNDLIFIGGSTFIVAEII